MLSENGTKYKADVNPGMTNEFATAVFRFAHSMIQGIVQTFATNNAGKLGQYQLSKNFFNSETYELKMEQIIMGLLNQPAQTFDKEVTTQVTNKLFPEEQTSLHGTDLVARNIQRGRDHGLPGFCCYYQKFQDPDFDCFQGWQTRYEGFSEEDWTQLKNVYNCPSDIDLFIGGLVQTPPTNGGVTGDVFNKMKGN